MPTSSLRHRSTGSSIQSGQTFESGGPPKQHRRSLRRSGSKRNSSAAGSRIGSAAAFSTGSANPLLPPPIIQVGEGDDDVEIVVDVNAAATSASKKTGGRARSGRTRSGSSNSSRKREKLAALDSSASSPAVYPPSPIARRSPPDHAKRWSPPPFPFSSSSSLASSKSDLSASATSLISATTTGRRSTMGGGRSAAAEPAFRAQLLSLPNPQNPQQSQSTNHMTSLEGRAPDVPRAASSAPNLTTTTAFSTEEGRPVFASEDAASARGEERFREKEEVETDVDEEDAGNEERPFLSFAEMSIAISRWNHVVESQTIYGDAKRPVLTTTAGGGEGGGCGSRIVSSSRGASTRSSAGEALTAAARHGARKQPPHQHQTNFSRVYRDAAPKNCLKTIPSGGIKSSFFGGERLRSSGDPPSPAKSSAYGKAKRVPRLALVAGKNGDKETEGNRNGGFTRRPYDAKEWESQLPSEMRKIYRHFKSYDETPRLRRGGTFQDLLLKSRRQSNDDVSRADEDGDGSDSGKFGSKSNGKNVAFDLRAREKTDGAVAIDADNRATSGAPSLPSRVVGGVKSAPPPSNPASREKLYRRHIARFYARSAAKFEDIDDSMFPELPDLPAAATSPFLDDARNQRIWQWLNRDFCKTKLDYFLSLCS